MALTEKTVELKFERISEMDQQERLARFLSRMKPGRGVKSYANETVAREVLEDVIRSAGTSPSGANQQPWSFVLVSDSNLKKQIRREVEEADETLEQAPFVLALFKQKYGLKEGEGGERIKVKHYYANESAGICAGFLITALNQAGLDYKLHPPAKSLATLLRRPENEETFMLFSVGIADEIDEYPASRLEDKVMADIPFSVPPLRSENKNEEAISYYHSIKKRRNVRDFSTDHADKQLLEKAFSALHASPLPDSYRFVVISETETKRLIREKAEEEEKKFYEEKITEEWRETLKPLGTNWEKKHLTDAPYLIIGFKVQSETVLDNLYSKNARPVVSSAVNTGILMSAIHHANLCMLTHTPSPMTFLRDLLERPKNELPIVVVPVGYPAENCEVPDISKKTLEEILTSF